MFYVKRPRIASPRFVPLGAVEIDWTHPLTRGLVAYWAFGSGAGLNDLCGNVPTLVPQSGASAAATPHGPGWAHTANSAALVATTPATLKFTASGSLFWTGRTLGVASGGTMGYLGVHPDDTGASPFDCYGILNQTSDNLVFNTNGTSVNIGVGTGVTVTSIGASFVSSGTVIGYRDGAQSGTNTIGAVATAGATSQVSVGGYPAFSSSRYTNALSSSAGIWATRVLTADEFAWLRAEPFAFVKPVRRRRFYSAAAVYNQTATASSSPSSSLRLNSGVVRSASNSATSAVTRAGSVTRSTVTSAAALLTNSVSASKSATTSVSALLTRNSGIFRTADNNATAALTRAASVIRTVAISVAGTFTKVITTNRLAVNAASAARTLSAGLRQGGTATATGAVALSAILTRAAASVASASMVRTAAVSLLGAASPAASLGRMWVLLLQASNAAAAVLLNHNISLVRRARSAAAARIASRAITFSRLAQTAPVARIGRGFTLRLLATNAARGIAGSIRRVAISAGRKIIAHVLTRLSTAITLHRTMTAVALRRTVTIEDHPMALDDIHEGDTDVFQFDFGAWFGTPIDTSHITLASQPAGWTFAGPSVAANKVTAFGTAPMKPGIYALLCTVTDGTPRTLTLQGNIRVKQ